LLDRDRNLKVHGAVDVGFCASLDVFNSFKASGDAFSLRTEKPFCSTFFTTLSMASPLTAQVVSALSATRSVSGDVSCCIDEY